MSTRIEVTKLAQIGDALVEDAKLIEITLASALVGSSVQDLDAALDEVRGLAAEASDDADAAAVSAGEALSHKNDAAASASAADNSASDAAVSETNAAASEDSAEQDRILAEAAALIAQQNGGGLAPNLSLRDAIRAANKRTYSGSGFAEWGNTTAADNHEAINEGLHGIIYRTDRMSIGRGRDTNVTGNSRTDEAIAIVDGIEYTLDRQTDSGYDLAEVNFPTAPDGSKTLNSATGEVHKYHDLAGVGEEYEAHTVDFDGSTNTHLELTDSPYYLPVGSKIELKFKLDTIASNSMYLLDAETPRVYLYKLGSTGTLNFVASQFQEVKVNGEVISSGTLVLEQDVEYHLEAISNVAVSIETIGSRYSGNETWRGQIWDITLSSSEEGVEPITYNTVTTQPKADEAPVVTEIDAGDNPDMPTGYMPAYQADGYVSIPEFPLADSMNISMIVRADDVSNDMIFGKWLTREYLAVRSIPSTGLYVYVGERSFNFDEIRAGRIYAIDIQIQKNADPATDYTVTVQVNQQTQVDTTVLIANSTYDNFGLGGNGTGGNTANRWDGDIFGFEIEYPDMPDLNRSYSSVEAVDPSGRLTVKDDAGFGAEDWTPSFDELTDGYISIPVWSGTTGDTIEVVVSGWNSGYLFANSQSSSPRVYLTGSKTIGFTGLSEVLVNGEPAVHDVTPIDANKTYHIKATLSTDSAIDLLGRQWNSEVTGATINITNVRLTDASNPENSRHYPLVINSATRPTTLVAEDAGYAKDTAPFYTPDYSPASEARFVSIPTWDYGIGDTLKCKFIAPTTASGIKVMFSSSDGAAWIGHTDGIVWSLGGTGNTATLDGVPITQAVTRFPTDGMEHELIVTFNRVSNVFRFGTHFASAYPIDFPIWDIELTDNTDPTNSRYYPSLDYRLDGDTSGTVLDGSNHQAPTGKQTVTANCEGSSTLMYSGIGANPTPYGTTGGDTVFVTINSHSPAVLRGTLQVGIEYECQVSNWSGTDYQSHVIYPPAEAGHANAWISSGNMNQLNVTVRYTPNPDIDGTLVNFPVNAEWTLAQVDGASNGTLENFPVGSEWDNDLPVTDGTMVGFATPWAYETGRYIGTVVGSTTQVAWDVQDSQKAFNEAKYNADFQVITSRKDLVFLETWLEKVEGFVRPYGNVQFGGSSHDGITLVPVTNFKDQGYSAFGEWDIDTVGKVADWDAMTPAERAAWGTNTANGLYFNPEDGEYYQDSYRIRTVEGLNDEPFLVTPKVNGSVSSTAMGWFNSGNKRIHRQGANTVALDYEGNFFLSGNHTSNPLLGSPETFVWVGDEGNEIAMPIALVQRLNQGAYHPTWNSSGCKEVTNQSVDGLTIVNGQPWYFNGTGGTPTSTSECFVGHGFGDAWAAGAYKVTGAIGQDSGRSDQYKFYDAIYAGQVEDLRLNANKQNKQELLTDAVRRGVRGETRGKGKVPFTTGYGSSVASLASGTIGYIPILRTDLLGDDSWITSTSIPNPDEAHGYIIIDGVPYEIYGAVLSGTGNTHIGFLTSYPTAPSAKTGVDIVFGNWLSAEYDSLPWVDIIGDPERIAATFPDGVVGQWIPQIPDGSSIFYFFNEKANGDATRTHTIDDGVSWTLGGLSEDFVRNGYSSGLGANHVALLQYETLSDFTESDDNRAVIGDLGDVEVTKHNGIDRGNRLAPSLSGAILKSSSGSPEYGTLSVLSNTIFRGELVETAYGIPVTHTPVNIGAPSNNSPAVKALPHLVEKDGLLYVQWHGTQLVYGSPTITTITPTNVGDTSQSGEVYFCRGIGGALDGSVWKCLVGTSQDFDSPNWFVNTDGDIENFGQSSKVVYFKRLDQLSWGDDSEITIVDGEATKGDFNGNIVKVVTHTELIPVGIANKNESL